MAATAVAGLAVLAIGCGTDRAGDSNGTEGDTVTPEVTKPEETSPPAVPMSTREVDCAVVAAPSDVSSLLGFDVVASDKRYDDGQTACRFDRGNDDTVEFTLYVVTGPQGDDWCDQMGEANTHEVGAQTRARDGGDDTSSDLIVYRCADGLYVGTSTYGDGVPRDENGASDVIDMAFDRVTAA